MIERAEHRDHIMVSLLFLYMGPWAAAKNLYASVAAPSALARVPTQWPLAPSVTTVANDKGVNEVKLDAVHRSLGLSLSI